MKQSSELTFIDSSSNMEELSLRVFPVCTHSVAGALPLGIIIVSDERTTNLVEGFTLLKNCMGDDAFFGRKCLGPRVIMTDNCSELRCFEDSVATESAFAVHYSPYATSVEVAVREEKWRSCRSSAPNFIINEVHHLCRDGRHFRKD